MNVPANNVIQQTIASTDSTSVNDKDVMEVRQALKKNGSVADLFGDDSTTAE